MEHQLVRGQALVLTGPQGCGKTTLAVEIALAHGTYREIDAAVLGSPFALGAVLSLRPNTLIVEGFPDSEDTLRHVVAMITNETVLAERKFLPPKEVRTPNFIFCTGHLEPLQLGSDNRRFCVVPL